jgi:hypothetical protein
MCMNSTPTEPRYIRFELLDQIAQPAAGRQAQQVGRHRCIEVGLGQAELLKGERLGPLAGSVEGVELGREVPPASVGEQEGLGTEIDTVAAGAGRSAAAGRGEPTSYPWKKARTSAGTDCGSRRYASCWASR